MRQNIERKLAAIIFTDIVDFTKLMGKDEVEAFKLVNKKLELIKPSMILVNCCLNIVTIIL